MVAVSLDHIILFKHKAEGSYSCLHASKGDAQPAELRKRDNLVDGEDIFCGVFKTWITANSVMNLLIDKDKERAEEDK